MLNINQISSRMLGLLEEVSELFERLSMYLPIFEKWATLFPRADYEELSECLMGTYLEYVNVLVGMIIFLRGSGIGTELKRHLVNRVLTANRQYGSDCLFTFVSATIQEIRS